MTKDIAYLLITCDTGKIKDVLSKIKILDPVKEIQETCGAYDIIGKVEFDTLKQLHLFVTEKIRPISDIRSTMTLRCTEVLIASEAS